MRAAASLRLRLLAGAALWIGLALLAAWFAVGGLLRETLERSFDTRLEAVMLSLLATIEVGDDGVVGLDRPLADPAFDRVLSGWYWQVTDGGTVRLRSRSLWTESLPVAAAGTTGAQAQSAPDGPDGRRLRLLARTVTVPGSDRPLTLAVAGPQAAIDVEAAGIARTLAIALAVLGAGLALAVLLQTSIGLAPFRRLGCQLADIRGGRRDSLDDDTFAEVAPLVREVNALLRHDQAVVARARTHAGNLAHALKTPLSVLSLEAERAGSAEMAAACRQMERMIRHHLGRARAAASHGVLGARVEVAPVLAGLLGVLERVHAERGVVVASSVAEGAAFAGERQDLEEMLGNLLDNAFKWAAGGIAIDVHQARGRLLVGIADDGPGLTPAEAARATEPGIRLDEATEGDGFGLAIAGDLAGLYGGSLVLDRAEAGGLRARLDLPAAP
ncbi:signal transduction histidine kinase [Stella humosa]|uniref:histidine kinase n=1 Tax=Stella humosa TaxID=94 RepID=A0A3N1KVS3_9PROT|nr:ATP-binding protein [Stella humosa]ROP84044.1 signal transduction histidine kinase [Stella humosa]BBK33555.1 ATPase [Stella humosa]